MAETKPESFIEAVKAGIDADRQAANKWDTLYAWFKAELGISQFDVGPKLLTQRKQLSNRIRKELAELDPKYIVLVVDAEADFDLTHVEAQLAQANMPRAMCAILFKELTPERFLVFESDHVVEQLAEIFGWLPVEQRARPVVSHGEPGGFVGKVIPPHIPLPTSISIPDRVRRMVRLAVASNPAVILVGPPGTGKTTLIRELIDEIRADHKSFGFIEPVMAPKWATPDESWTATDLVGGDTVDETGALRFRPGRVLEAISENRWLVLDEINRADMDKIFGALLTWLSGQSVELGRAAKNMDSPVVTLAWSDTAESETLGTDELSVGKPSGTSIRYAAGNEWRLIGTYNAVDAQRVFKMGQAIGRRFARVPIPPPTSDEFRNIISPLTSEMPGWVLDAISNLYSAHLEGSATTLGPAMFLRLPEYVLAGINSEPHGSKTVDSGDTQPLIDLPDNAAIDPEPAFHLNGTIQARELLAEAYVVHLGAFVARYDESILEQLTERIVLSWGVFTPIEWDWIIDNSRNFA